MKLFKNKSGRYAVHYRDASGKLRTKSTKRKNKEDAQEIVSKAKIAELEQAAEIGLLRPALISCMISGKSMSVQDAIEPWLEWRQLLRHSPHTLHDAKTWVMAWAKSVDALKKKLASITERDIDPWINSADSSNKLGSRMVMLSALRSFFAFCSAKGWCLGDPSRLVRVDPGVLLHAQKETYKQPVFDDDEIASLLMVTSAFGESPSRFWNAAIAIARYTGLRLGDIACLEWSCFVIPGKIAVWTRKRDKRIELPIEPYAFKSALLGLPRDHPIFVFPRERSIILDPNRRAMLSTEFRQLCDKCSIPFKSFHGLRATYISDCAEKGIPIEHIAANVGHSNPTTTLGYYRVRE